MTEITAPLEGVRVLNLGGRNAGQVSAMLLADQGADVIEVYARGTRSDKAAPLLSRGKRIIELDFDNDRDRAHVQELVADVDVVICNLQREDVERYGFTQKQLGAKNKGLVYLTQPGFASSDSRAALEAWEGVVCAATGIYTDLNIIAPLVGLPPIYSAVPMASAYAGVHGAIAASMAVYASLRTGEGQSVEVPMADSVMSAVAILVAEIEDLPSRYHVPSIDDAMRDVAFPIFRDLSQHFKPEHLKSLVGYLGDFAPPGFDSYICGDGRFIFFSATDHVHQTRALLETLGIFDQLISEGLVVATPYDPSEGGNNLNNTAAMSIPWRKRIRGLIQDRLQTKLAAEWEIEFRNAAVPCTVVQTTEEWLDHVGMKEAEVVCELEDPLVGQTKMAGRFVTISGHAIESPVLRARVMEGSSATWLARAERAALVAGAGPNSLGPLAGLRVLDLGNVIAAPTVGRVLAEFGADVTRIDAPAPQAGPLMTMWFGIDVNQGKKSLLLDLKSEKGKEVFYKLVANADVVIHNFLGESPERLGISQTQLREVNPNIISCQISAWGGPTVTSQASNPSFDPVVQNAVGITFRYGNTDSPTQHGLASCVDYISGYAGALAVTHALIARELGRGGSYVKTSLAMGAQLVQYPFVVDYDGYERNEASGQQAKGEGPHQRMYLAADGWVFVGCRHEDTAELARRLDADSDDCDSIAAVILKLSFEELEAGLSGLARAAVVRVTDLKTLRAQTEQDSDSLTQTPLNDGGLKMVRFDHPSDHRVCLPLPTWYRMEKTSARRLCPAPFPGINSREILAENGWNATEIDQLIENGDVLERWAVMKDYFPR